MITEKNIRELYRLFYDIAETYGDVDNTRNLYNQLMGILSDGRLPTNLVLVNKKGIPKNVSEHFEAVKLITRLHNEYGSKFRELETKQKTLEAKAK